jgi:hypothetical protein
MAQSDAQAVAKALHAMLKKPANVTKDKDALKAEISTLLNTNGFNTPAQRMTVKAKLRSLIIEATPAPSDPTTGVCYWDVGGVLNSKAPSTAAECAGETNSLFVPELTARSNVYEALKEEGITLVV